jgi:type II secretory pathway component PulK
MRRRRGFALLAVLSVMVSAVALGVVLSTRGGDAVTTAQERVRLTRAAWLADGCIAEARSAIDDLLADDRGAARSWLRLDSLVAATTSGRGCVIVTEPSGMRLDVNSSEPWQLQALFVAAGSSVARADSVVDALIDWRDADADTRPLGAERTWYDAARRPSPRNGPLASVAELRLVRGLELDSVSATLLGVEPERMWLDRAPLPVIAALPGMSTQALEAIAERRQFGRPVGELAALADNLGGAARTLLLGRYAELAGLTTSTPEAWTITACATPDGLSSKSCVAVRLARAGARAAVVRRRSWP